MNKFTCAFSFCCGILLGIAVLILLCGCGSNSSSSGGSSSYRGAGVGDRLFHGSARPYNPIALLSPPSGGFGRPNRPTQLPARLPRR